MSRILNLASQVHVISKGQNPAARVIQVGENETGVLAIRINEMLNTINDRNKKIRDIIENVHVGFLVVNAHGLIEKGYTNYCHTIFGSEKLTGAKFSHILFDSVRERENFDIFFEQAIESLAPEELTLAQLPSKVRYHDGKYLKIEASGLYQDTNKLFAILFTVSDITHLEEAERKSRENAALIKILKFIDHFAAFKAGVRSTLEQLIATRMAEVDQVKTRRALHTLKGNFGVFGLHEIVSVIHEIESLPCIGQGDVVMIQDVFSEFLRQHKDLTGLDYLREWKPVINVPITKIQDLAAAARTWENLETAVLQVEDFAVSAMGSSFGELVAPLVEAGIQLANRFNKKVEFTITGGETVINTIRTRDLIANISHAVRNAIDHGIETSNERRKVGKPAVGTIWLSASIKDGRVLISISDNGRGLDSDKLIKSAIDNHKLAEISSRELSVHDVSNLIFLDGVSSKSSSNESSGRGIGLSALKSAVERLGGSISVSWKQGNGTSIHMSLPDEQLRIAS